MEIESSSLFYEIEKITKSGATGVAYYWTAEVHYNGLTSPAIKMVGSNTFRDYEKNMGDETTVELMFGMGVYAKQIYPNRNNLEITLSRQVIDESGFTSADDRQKDSQRYKAILVLEGQPNVEGSEFGELSEGTLDLRGILNVHFQLLDRELEKIRTITVGGIYRGVKPTDVLLGVLSKECNRNKLSGGATVQGIDIVEASNVAKRDHILIPQGTKLVNLPQFIQERCGGIYSSGIGSYMQNGIWYVFPLFDTTKLNRVERTITLFKVPARRYTGIERTFRVEGKSVFILGTSDTVFKDDGGTEFINSGNGVRFTDANQLMSSPVKTAGGKALMNRRKLNSEFISAKAPDGVNNVQMSSDAISANPFNEYSKLAAKNGGIFTFIWENANPSLLFPGMRAKIMYLDEGNIKELSGVLLGAQVVTQLAGQGLTANRHKTSVGMSLFVNPYED